MIVYKILPFPTISEAKPQLQFFHTSTYLNSTLFPLPWNWWFRNAVASGNDAFILVSFLSPDKIKNYKYFAEIIFLISWIMITLDLNFEESLISKFQHTNTQEISYNIVNIPEHCQALPKSNTVWSQTGSISIHVFLTVSVGHRDNTIGFTDKF